MNHYKKWILLRVIIFVIAIFACIPMLLSGHIPGLILCIYSAWGVTNGLDIRTREKGDILR